MDHINGGQVHSVLYCPMHAIRSDDQPRQSVVISAMVRTKQSTAAELSVWISSAGSVSEPAVDYISAQLHGN